MGTRSDIIVHRADGKWVRVYCHWDGYLDHNGRILFEHYNSQERAEALVAPGDMSSLAEQCTKPKGHSFDKRVEGYTVYYGRDRGETGTEAKVGKTLHEVWPKQDTWTEFTYVWDDGKWWVGDPDEGTQTLIELGPALRGEKGLSDDLSRTEFGAVEGHVVGITTHYRKPAFMIRERLREKEVKCVLTDAAARKVGAEHDWREAWSGQRVLVSGRLHYNSNGDLIKVDADDVSKIAPVEVTLKDIQRPAPDGASAREYLDRLWGEPDA